MSFINENANLVLLFLILLTATTLVGATVFFQNRFDKINSEYAQKVADLQTVSNQLDQQKAQLDNISSELSVKSQREQALGAQYTQVTATRDQLESQNKDL